MNGDSNRNSPGIQKRIAGRLSVAQDRLLGAIIVVPIIFAISILILFLLRGTGHSILELAWFTPMFSAFVALIALSVAFLALGRYQVQCDPISYWIGMAFAGFGVGLLFYVLSWPGLLPGDRSFIASLPNTAGWISPLSITIPGLLLLAAALLRWPSGGALTRRKATGSMVAWILSVGLGFSLLVRFEQQLPTLVRSDGTFTQPLVIWNVILILVFAFGTFLSARRYHQTGDRLIGYVTFFQIALVFSPLLTILGGRRYDLWWYLARGVLVSGCLIVLFGLFVEYIHLFRRVREGENRYRQITESLPQLIWTCAADGGCTYLSPQWLAYTGVPEAEQLGSGWILQIHPEDRQRVTVTWQASVTSGSHLNTEYRIRRYDGSYRWFKSVALPLHDSQGNIHQWFGASTDIEDQKQAEAELKTYAEELERSNRDLKAFAYVASHDLQEPLRKIQAFGDLLLEKADSKNDQHRDILIRMRSSASRMRSMVDGLLQLSQLETHAQPFQPVDLNGVLQDVLADLELQIEQKNAVINICDLPVVDADPVQIRRLFQNIISNALKFQTPDNQSRVDICLGQAEANSVQILVKDNGIGFDEAHAAHLYEPFKRLVGRTKYEGSGMGLAICRKIVERHHGMIIARSKPGQGTTFIVTLPIHQQQTIRPNGRLEENGAKTDDSHR